MLPLWEGAVITNGTSSVTIDGGSSLIGKVAVGDHLLLTGNPFLTIDDITTDQSTLILNLDKVVTMSGIIEAFIFRMDRNNVSTANALNSYLSNVKPSDSFNIALSRILNVIPSGQTLYGLESYLPLIKFIQDKRSVINDEVDLRSQSISVYNVENWLSTFKKLTDGATVTLDFIKQRYDVLENNIYKPNDQHAIITTRENIANIINQNGVGVECVGIDSPRYTFQSGKGLGICPVYTSLETLPMDSIITHDNSRSVIKPRTNRFMSSLQNEQLLFDRQNVTVGIVGSVIDLPMIIGKRTVSVVIELVTDSTITIGFNNSSSIDTGDLAIINLKEGTFTRPLSNDYLDVINITPITNSRYCVDVMLSVIEPSANQTLFLGFTDPNTGNIEYAPDEDQCIAIQFIGIRNGHIPFDYCTVNNEQSTAINEVVSIPLTSPRSLESNDGTWLIDWGLCGSSSPNYSMENPVTVMKHYTNDPLKNGAFSLAASYDKGTLTITASSPLNVIESVTLDIDVDDNGFRTVVVKSGNKISFFTNGSLMGSITIDNFDYAKGGVLLSDPSNDSKGRVIFKRFIYAPNYTDLSGALQISSRPNFY